MKFTDIISTAIGNSFRSRLRTLLTVLAIFIGAFTLTITNGLGTGVNNYIDTQIASFGASDTISVDKPVVATTATEGPAEYDPDASVIAAGTAAGGPGATVIALTDDDLTALAEIPGVTLVEPVVALYPDYIETESSDKFQLSMSLIGNSASLDLAAGTAPDNSSGANQLVITTDYLGALGFDTADDAIGTGVEIGITDAAGEPLVVDATVVGVQEETLVGGGATANSALSDAIYAAQRTGLPEGASTEYSRASATFASGTDVTALKADLVAAGYTGTTVADQIGTFQTVVDAIVLILNAFAVIALIAAGFGIINTLLMSVQERTREIGLMKAMGMSSARIFTLFSSEAVFIGFLGSALGAGAAMIVGTAVSAVLAGGVLAGLAGLQLLTFTIGDIAIVFALVMAIAFIASTLPATRAARQSPIDSLRYE